MIKVKIKILVRYDDVIIFYNNLVYLPDVSAVVIVIRLFPINAKTSHFFCIIDKKILLI